VAAVTSVRQASIPFSVLLGGLWLKEGLMGRRPKGVACVVHRYYRNRIFGVVQGRGIRCFWI